MLAFVAGGSIIGLYGGRSSLRWSGMPHGRWKIVLTDVCDLRQTYRKVQIFPFTMGYGVSKSRVVRLEDSNVRPNRPPGRPAKESKSCEVHA